MSTIISVENLCKAYRIGVADEKHDTLAATVASWVKAPLRNLRRLSSLNVGNSPANSSALASSQSKDIHWALRGVSFEVKEGEVVGIIGRNGAGKSTLLKILSRITEPTSGRAVIRGRVSSLLEVGTGFHPELSGRDNVYMNGTILGMRKREIDRKFDEIVDFSGIEKFIDTPIKRYSSGMKVRLAFAVAAHLEPELLVIDEVLAVGDQEFQQKCTGKMKEVAKGNRTVLFVSHNMAAIEGLCHRALLMQRGELAGFGDVQSQIARYLMAGGEALGNVDLSKHTNRSNELTPSLQQLTITSNQHPEPIARLPIGSDITFSIAISTVEKLRYARLAIRILNNTGVRVATCHTEYQYPRTISIQRKALLKCTIHNCRLAPGIYSLDLQLDEHRTIVDKIESAATFEVSAADIYGTGRTFPHATALFYPDTTWQVTEQ